jgi:hypothetical protein
VFQPSVRPFLSNENDKSSYIAFIPMHSDIQGHPIFFLNSMWWENYLEDPVKDGRMLLKYILMKKL